MTYKLATPKQLMGIAYYVRMMAATIGWMFESGVECRLLLEIPRCEEWRLLRRN